MSWQLICQLPGSELPSCHTLARTEVEEIAAEVSELQMKQREAGLEVSHLLERVTQQHDCKLLSVILSHR